METRFIKAKGVFGEFYINVNHIMLLSTYIGGKKTTHYVIQYEDCYKNYRNAEISKEDYESLTMSVGERLKIMAEKIERFRKERLGDEKND